MATKNHKSQEGDKKEAATAAAPEAAAPEAAAKTAPAIGQRGLKGVPLTAKITLVAEKNPKRPGCAAEKRFALYATGKTIEQFLEEGGTTPDLAYDTSHGYITVEGYTPPKVFTPKVRTPKAPKEPKVKKEKVAKDTKAQEAVEQLVVEETID